jgi:branched-subunit amino acid transport protein AzlD
VVVVALLQWRTRQTLLSIAAGTALYVGLRAL